MGSNIRVSVYKDDTFLGFIVYVSPGRSFMTTTMFKSDAHSYKSIESVNNEIKLLSRMEYTSDLKFKYTIE